MSIFKVVYCDENGNSLMDPTIVTYGQSSHLRKMEISKDGYRFKGWYARRTSDQKVCYDQGGIGKKKYYKEGKQPEGWMLHLYHDECEVAKLSKVDGDVITMQAQWESCLIDAPDHVEDNREILREKLLHRPIVLFGGGTRCKNFYQKYHEILNIRCILTDKKKEKKIILDDGTVVNIEPYSKNKIHSDDYIIVCRPVKLNADGDYANARRILTSSGLEHANDFIRISIARGILDGRKISIWMGFCQFGVFRNIYKRIDSIQQEFVVEGMRLERETIKTSYKFQDCQDMMKICDVLVHTPLIFADGKVDFDYLNLLPKDAKVVSIPRIEFRGYYPYKDNDLLTHHKYTYDRKNHWPFNYAENFLDELILKGLNDDEIYEEVMRDDFIDEAVIRKNLKLAFKSIQISENTANIKILDYIKENFTKRMLYRDGLHYQNDMYFELARRVADYLNLDIIDDINNIEQETEKEGIQYLDFTEIPVLPCVAKTLGLDFITDETLWRVRFTEMGENIGAYEIRTMTRKEWIYAYVAYTRAQMTLGELWNLKNGE